MYVLERQAYSFSQPEFRKSLDAYPSGDVTTDVQLDHMPDSFVNDLRLTNSEELLFSGAYTTL